MNRVVVSLVLPPLSWRNRNVVPARGGPSGVFTTDSTPGSVIGALSSRARKNPKTSSTGRAIVTVDWIFVMGVTPQLGARLS